MTLSGIKQMYIKILEASGKFLHNVYSNRRNAHTLSHAYFALDCLYKADTNLIDALKQIDYVYKVFNN